MRLPWSICLALLTTLAGCFETDIEVAFDANGSGTQNLRLCLSGQALGTLRGAVDAVEASATRVDPLDVFDAKKVRGELEAAGLTLLSHQTSEPPKGRTVELQVRFTDLTTLRNNPLTGGSRATWQVSRGTGKDDVRLVYFPQGEVAWRAARDKARDLARAPDATVQHFVTSRLAQIEGLDVTLALTLPGDVIAHTANMQAEGRRKVVAKIKASDIHSATDLLVRLAPRYEVIFACPGFPIDAAIGSREGDAAAPPQPAATTTKPTPGSTDAGRR